MNIISKLLFYNLIRYDLSSLRIVNSGAAPLSKEIQEEIFKRTKIAVRQGYGMSETPTGIHYYF